MESKSGSIQTSKYKIEYTGTTDIGRNRSINEDSYLLMPRESIYAVADGAGGLEGGEVASKTTVDVLEEVLCESVPLAKEEPSLIALASCYILNLLKTSNKNKMSCNRNGWHCKIKKGQPAQTGKKNGAF